ncbi:MAG: DUF4062 domain-containing protein [Gallionellaceae bacterium]|nr:MAG: DUF4062 domain-containing protein [Gallionellaceae bacterium]
MARPRIFVSSTYFDLKVIREDLDRFITSFGYEPVRHEQGHISYGREEKPEVYAYREIDFCDILISVIGGKFGSAATDSEYSISQRELKTAYDLGKQVYIFVESSVLSEFKYYQANKDVKGVRFTAVNDPRVYSFLEEIYALPKGNPIFSFETGTDLTTILREQLAGLFQRLLVEDSNKVKTSLTQELQRSLQTVDQLVKFLTDEKTKGNTAVEEILFSNHPIFDAIKTLINNKYRVYFTNLKELNDWLEYAKAYSAIPADEWDDHEYMEWVRDVSGKTKKEIQILSIKKNLFTTDGQLKPISPASWNDSWAKIERRELSKSNSIDDDIPF